MSWKEYEETCTGCQPVILDCATKQQLPADHPYMKALMLIWENATYRKRRAFHNVTCNNSRDPADLRLCGEIIDAFKAASEGLPDA